MRYNAYGHVPPVVANLTLTNGTNLAQVGEELDEAWAAWVDHLPFDATVAQHLAALYAQRLAATNSDRDAPRARRLEQKLALTRERATRYGGGTP